MLKESSTRAHCIEHAKFTVTLRTDGVMHVHFNAHTLITVELQEELIVAYNTVTKVKRPFIFTGDEFVSITAEARTNAVTMAPRVPIMASAIVVRNLAQKIIADYYYKFNKPPVPYKVFRKFDEGLEWVFENFEIAPVPFV